MPLHFFIQETRVDNYLAFNRPDSYPGYTLEQLKAFVANGEGNAKIEAEIIYRENIKTG